VYIKILGTHTHSTRFYHCMRQHTVCLILTIILYAWDSTSQTDIYQNLRKKVEWPLPQGPLSETLGVLWFGCIHAALLFNSSWSRCPAKSGQGIRTNAPSLLFGSNSLTGINPYEIYDHHAPLVKLSAVASTDFKVLQRWETHFPWSAWL
jgi:hypothetical protein